MIVKILSGRFSAGRNFQCGQNVVIDVSEEVTVGDRVVLADNTHISGRKVVIGDDFYGYGGYPNGLEIGRGRIDEEDAILTVGSRCTFHNNRIDLARAVTIGNDVGLSPDVVFYTHGYWMSMLEGYPTEFRRIHVGSGSIIGFRSVVLPGSIIGERCVVGAQSTVRGSLTGHSVWAGSPVKFVREISEPHPAVQHRMLLDLLGEYERFCQYRGWPAEYLVSASGNRVAVKNCLFNVKTLTCEGEECIFTDDFRDFMFRRGLRFYTQRPFRRMAGTRIERNKP